MADIEVSYKGSTIGSLSATGNLTLETAGKYCEANIGISYTKSGGGGGAQWTLTASGSFTKTTAAGGVTIPVTYTGKPKLMILTTPTPLSATAQAIYAAKYIHWSNDSIDPTTLINGLAISYYKKADNSEAASALLPNNFTLGDNIYCAQISGTYKWQQNTYRWYLYDLT